MPTLAYHASTTAAAAVANLTKYSEMMTTDHHNKTQQITGTLSRHTMQIARMGALANASIVQQFICVFQGTPQIITQPKIASDAAHTPIYLAGLGDKIEHLVPVAFPAVYRD